MVGAVACFVREQGIQTPVAALTVAEVTNRIYKGQIWLRIAAKTLSSCTGTAGRSTVLSALHTTGPTANCKLLDQTCLTSDSLLCNGLVVPAQAF